MSHIKHIMPYGLLKAEPRVLLSLLLTQGYIEDNWGNGGTRNQHQRSYER